MDSNPAERGDDEKLLKIMDLRLGLSMASSMRS